MGNRQSCCPLGDPVERQRVLTALWQIWIVLRRERDESRSGCHQRST